MREFIRSFYGLMWDEDSPLAKQLEFTVLAKSNHEKAFVTIEVSKGCQLEGKAPLIVPFKVARSGDKSSFTSVFINHADAVKTRRKELALFFSKVLSSATHAT